MIEHSITEIKQWRKKLDLTQGQLAKLSNVSQSMIAKIESGLLDPTYTKAKQIFETLERLEKKEQKTVQEIMQKKVISVKPQSTIKETIVLMRKNGISQIPVIDSSIVGIVSESVILDSFMNGKSQETRVEEIMADAPPMIDENSILDVASHLLKHYPLIAVQKKGKVIGILTKADILGSF